MRNLKVRFTYSLLSLRERIRNVGKQFFRERERGNQIVRVIVKIKKYQARKKNERCFGDIYELQ